MTDKPDEIVEEMKRREAGNTYANDWVVAAGAFIPHALKLIAEKDKEIERMKSRLARYWGEPDA